MPNNTAYTMSWIHSDELYIPREDYQRKANDARVARIVAEFDERIANEPKVSARNGHFYVFDGQHTTIARVIRNNYEPLKILCKVYEGLTEEEEAHLFALQTGFASTPTSGERLRADLCAKDQTSLDFVADTESTGIKIDTNGSLSDGHLRCIKTAMNEYRDIGPELYIEALTIIVDAWAACADSLKHDIIKGLCRFVWYYHGEYNRERLIWRLNQLKPSDISDRIKLDIKTPPEKRFIKPFFEIYNGSSRIGALPKRF